MKKTSHSEYGQIEQIIIKSAASAFLSDKAIERSWEELNYLDKPALDQSVIEYAEFEKILSGCNIELLYLPESRGLSMDSIYCRDASVATDFGMIVCRMGKPERADEPAAQLNYFQKIGLPVLGEIKAPGTLEGGDVAWLDEKTLAVARSYRTNLEGISQLRSFLEPHGIEIIVVDLPHYKGESDVFHLMSIFSPVDEQLAVVYSPLMPIAFRERLIALGFDFVEVPDQEFETMACNVLALAPKKCLMLAENPITEQRLLDRGCEVHTFKGAHISVMGGGGPTCLTRPLKRLSGH